VKFLIEHLAYMTADSYPDPDAREKWLRMVKLAKKKYVFLGFSAIFFLMEEEYPCPNSIGLLHEVVNRVGAQKVLWGTDIPTTLNKYTYRQMMDLILKHASLKYPRLAL
jgi:hypothetical protein